MNTSIEAEYKVLVGDKMVRSQKNGYAAQHRQEFLREWVNGAEPNKKAANGPPQSNYKFT
jgi:hypothetical protein